MAAASSTWLAGWLAAKTAKSIAKNERKITAASISVSSVLYDEKRARKTLSMARAGVARAYGAWRGAGRRIGERHQKRSLAGARASGEQRRASAATLAHKKQRHRGAQRGIGISARRRNSSARVKNNNGVAAAGCAPRATIIIAIVAATCLRAASASRSSSRQQRASRASAA